MTYKYIMIFCFPCVLGLSQGMGHVLHPLNVRIRVEQSVETVHQGNYIHGVQDRNTYDREFHTT